MEFRKNNKNETIEEFKNLVNGSKSLYVCNECGKRIINPNVNGDNEVMCPKCEKRMVKK
ncbi:MAG: Zinc-ribbon domain-containing protein [Promethearchaeota archaeon]|nr:MAG: Zinc-ribbon domain-containing protein [Candidatus Lokiarchaeota archaeon]